MALERLRIILTGDSAKALDAIESTEVKVREGTADMTKNYERFGERVGAIFEAVGAKGEELGIAGSGSLSAFGKHLGAVDKDAKSFGASMVSVGNKMILGLGAGAAFFGYESVKNAMQFDAAQSQLRAALGASHISWARHQSVIEGAENAETSWGFTDEQTVAALSQGVIATGSLTKARRELALASDLARYKDTDLASAELVVNRALAGNLRGIKSLGMNLNVVAGGAHQVAAAHLAYAQSLIKIRDLQIQDGDLIDKGGKDWDTYQMAVMAASNAHLHFNEVEHSGTIIMKALNEKLQGQAQMFSETLPGKIDIFKAKIDTVEKNVGNWLIPKLTGALNFAGEAIDTVEKNPALMAVGATVIGLPIIAALGAFANDHIIKPIASLGRIFSGTSKTLPLDANTTALERLTDVLGGSDVEGGGLAAKTGEAGLVGGGAAEGLEGLGAGIVASMAAAPALAAVGAIIAVGLYAKIKTDEQNAHNTFLKDALNPASWVTRSMLHDELTPVNQGAGTGVTNATNPRDLIHDVNTIMMGIGTSIPTGGQLLRNLKGGGYSDSLTPANLASLAGMFGLKVGNIIKAEKMGEERDQSVSMERAIATALMGKSKNPQIVKLLDETGLGKMIGTQSGDLVAKSIIAASKDQTKNWNLPYVIAQGFGKVDGTIGKTLNEHLTGSASKQDGANRDLVTGARATSSAAGRLSSSAGEIQTAAGALVAAAQALGSNITVNVTTPTPRRTRKK